uniref:RIMB1/RIM3A-C-like N-terminal domain-containing protein n=1 Tax=Periophthalmus magnuspinnatus TaxID=409849 RepID=A0A3B4AIU5_9GOBI
MYFFVIKVFSFCILVFQNGTDYNILVRQNSELLRALDALEKTCATLREENGLLRKSSAPETEEKVRRLRRKNTELAILAKRLEDRALKLQEANLRVVNPPLMRPGSVEHYKRAFARQRARDLAQHADVLLCKDKEIAALQQECRELEEQLGTTKCLIVESQKEVLRLQRQLSVTSSTQQHSTITPDDLMQCGGTEKGDKEKRVYSTPHTLESELSKKRKECENLEHEAKKRQRRCLDLENQLEEERCKNEQLKEETDLLRRKAQLLYQVTTENDELREDLSEVTAQHNSVLEENQRLRAKLENLEQVLKHMREVAERRQQLELEHEQALAILKFKQDEIKRLQRAQLFAKREHEGVVQMLESTLDCMQSKVRDLEEKCRGQSEQFGLLSQELEKFRMQASKVDLLDALLTGPSITPPVVPPPPCVPVSPCSLPSPGFSGNVPANVSMLPSTLLPNTQATSHVVEPFANQPNALAAEDPCPVYVQGWANPSSAAALAVCDSALPAASNSPPMVVFSILILGINDLGLIINYELTMSL